MSIAGRVLLVAVIGLGAGPVLAQGGGASCPDPGLIPPQSNHPGMFGAALFRGPALARGDGQFAMAGLLSGSGSLLFHRFSDAGVALGLPTVLSQGAWPSDPSITWNGSGYAVAW